VKVDAPSASIIASRLGSEVTSELEFGDVVCFFREKSASPSVYLYEGNGMLIGAFSNGVSERKVEEIRNPNQVCVVRRFSEVWENTRSPGTVDQFMPNLHAE
jgi:hypothetical protein